jgi:hypothetical protein
MACDLLSYSGRPAMKIALKEAFKKKQTMDARIHDCIAVTLKLLDLFLRTPGHEQLAKAFDSVCALETEQENLCNTFVEDIDRKLSLPFYWEDIYTVFLDLKKLFSLLVVYYNKACIFKSPKSFSQFFQIERNILLNIRAFFSEYRKKRLYVGELLKNNNFELKNFSKTYFNAVTGIINLGQETLAGMNILALFERMNEINENLQGAMKKIYIDTNL